MCQWIGSALVQKMTCHLFGTKPLLEPMLDYCWLDSWEQISIKSNRNSIIFTQENAFEIVVCQSGVHFVQGGRWINHSFVKPSFLQFQIYKASFNSLAPGRCSCNLRLIIFKLISEIEISSAFPLKLPSAESHNASLMINQHWFG